MAMRSPGSDCADGADCDCAGIRRPPRARIYGRLIDQCMASGTSSSTYETGFPPLDRGRYSGRERSGAPPPMLSMSSRTAASGIAPVGAVEASPFVVRQRTLPRASVRTAVQGGASLFIGAEDWTYVKPLTVDDGVHMVGQAVEQRSGQCRFRLLARDRYARVVAEVSAGRGGPQ